MDIYQHFRPEERPFIDQVLEWKADVSMQYTWKRTDFLDPREQEIVGALVGRNDDVSVSFWGGSEHAERKRACLIPPYLELAEEDYGLTLFELSYPKKFLTIDHRQVLGACMSLGVKREKFGDILVADERIQLVVATEIAEFVRLHLTSVGKAQVEMVELGFEQMLVTTESWHERTATVSSLRLDAVIGEMLSLSRAKAAELVEKGRVKVNWKLVESGALTLQAGDHISVRGFGRHKLLEVEGKTKKDKFRLRIGRMGH
ncbi:RNA-binding protein [Halalkalibacterium halodurans]|jgi:RNA-binding protein YlmH|uniref:RNA-binding protein n=1 Tax=Halalkalibacterium halodurans TaxID=86665 RepID=A0A0M0KJ93_ALKHA|nr:RNA-binding protein [Halalkalibacterium halodurans]MED3646147.1 RNA-binding protein [Halalkalibacterium halodurans]TES53833.1 RNA-binding protein [Halalkalibacterium halodurans]TPE66252.1 RNA-binding protein [Halalkalibacterium halodurans]